MATSPSYGRYHMDALRIELPKRIRMDSDHPLAFRNTKITVYLEGVIRVVEILIF